VQRVQGLIIILNSSATRVRLLLDPLLLPGQNSATGLRTVYKSSYLDLLQLSLLQPSAFNLRFDQLVNKQT